jgi:hypothetical protein
MGSSRPIGPWANGVIDFVWELKSLISSSVKVAILVGPCVKRFFDKNQFEGFAPHFFPTAREAAARVHIEDDALVSYVQTTDTEKHSVSACEQLRELLVQARILNLS